jgi:hypothetical protein
MPTTTQSVPFPMHSPAARDLARLLDPKSPHSLARAMKTLEVVDRCKVALRAASTAAVGYGALALAPSPLWLTATAGAALYRLCSGPAPDRPFGLVPSLRGLGRIAGAGAGLAGAAALGLPAVLPLTIGLSAAYAGLVGASLLVRGHWMQGGRGAIVGALVGLATTLALATLGPAGWALTHLATMPSVGAGMAAATAATAAQYRLTFYTAAAKAPAHGAQRPASGAQPAA